jgi:Zn finger protein HypA/HybF involved in hydrogenase expression
MLLVFTYLIIGIIIASFSFGKRISFVNVFLISVFLTPIVGLISIFRSEKTIIMHHYRMLSSCNKCETEVEGINTVCPNCKSKTQVTFREINDLKVA